MGKIEKTRDMLQIRLRSKIKEAFWVLADHREGGRTVAGKLDCGEVPGSPSELAREILEEWTMCIYGVRWAVEAWFLGATSTSIRRPERLYQAIEKYERSMAAAASAPKRDSFSADLDKERSVEAMAAGKTTVDLSARSRTVKSRSR